MESERGIEARKLILHVVPEYLLSLITMSGQSLVAWYIFLKYGFKCFLVVRRHVYIKIPSHSSGTAFLKK